MSNYSPFVVSGWSVQGRSEKAQASGLVRQRPLKTQVRGSGWPSFGLMWSAGPVPTLDVIAEQILAPVPGGTGRLAAQILPALADTAPPQWQVRCVTAFHRDVSAATFSGVKGPRRVPVPGRILNVLWERGWPPRLGGDSVHAVTPLAPVRRVPQVVTVHDAVPWTHPETLTPRGVQWHRVMVGRAAETADAVVTPTRVVADELAGLFPALAPRLHVIGHGVSDLQPGPDADERAAQLGLPERYVLIVATLEPRKGLDVLLAAMTPPVAGPELAEISLVVVGPPGWGEVNVADSAVALGWDRKRLHVLGRLGDADLAVAYDRATVVAAPSRAEGFGLPVLEAFAAGVPVVCSDAPALVEVAGSAALITPREDPEALSAALTSVIVDESTADKLSAAGRLRAADFTWTAAAEKIWALHQSLR